MQTRAKLAIEPEKAAWMAGFLDGEGYVGVIRVLDKRSGLYSFRVQISVGQVFRAPLQVFMEHFGGTIVHNKNKHQGFYTWRIYSQQAYTMVRTLLPYLIVKKKQAELLLEFGETTIPYSERGSGRMIPAEVYLHRKAVWAALVELNGGRALQAERTSEEAPFMEGGAMFRPHGKSNRESSSEMKLPPAALQ